MAAPSITFNITRPTRVDGAPFTPAVYNADRVKVLSATDPGLVASVGSALMALLNGGANQLTFTSGTAGSLSLTNVTLGGASTPSTITSSGVMQFPEGIKIGPTTVYEMWTAYYPNETRNKPDIESYGAKRSVQFYFTMPSLFPEGLSSGAAQTWERKYVALVSKRTSDFKQALAGAAVLWNSPTGNTTALSIRTMPITSVPMADIMANLPGTTITASFDVIVLRISP